MSDTKEQLGEDGFMPSGAAHPMSRGLSQVLFNYLPERTFDYDRGACIGKVFELRIEEVKGIDVDRLCAAMAKYVSRWENRVDDFDIRRPHLLLFGRPTRVLFNLFPLTFQCGKCDCVKAFDNEAAFVKAGGAGVCTKCESTSRWEQIYHILVHECGHMSGLQPRNCPRCKSKKFIALDLRGSQQARDFRWLCKNCGETAGPVQRICPECQSLKSSEGEGNSAVMMRVIPHRANNSYYPHNVTIMNLPTETTARLRDHPNRDQIIATAIVEERYDLEQLLGQVGAASDPVMTTDPSLVNLLSRLDQREREEIERSLAIVEGLKKKAREDMVERVTQSAASLETGGWLEALEYVNLHTLDRLTRSDLREDLEKRHPGRGALVEQFIALGESAGITELQLIHDFPVVTAVFGFTRVSADPETQLGNSPIKTRFRGFSTLMTSSREQQRRRPIFVDDSSTEALLFKLRPSRIARWLAARGHQVPSGATTEDSEARKWLLDVSGEVDRFVTLSDASPVGRDVFVLVHSYAHIAIRALSRLSGLDRTSLAEYLFPRLGAFVVYNTKAGSNLGGLHTVFAELQEEFLRTLREDIQLQTCVYDPLCNSEKGSACHACMHLPETACKHYNRALSREILFSPDQHGERAGYLSVR